MSFKGDKMSVGLGLKRIQTTVGFLLCKSVVKWKHGRKAVYHMPSRKRPNWRFTLYKSMFPVT